MNVHRQDCLQRGYIELIKALLWLHEKLASLDQEELGDMLRKVPSLFSMLLPFFAYVSLGAAQTRRGLSSW